MPTKKAVAASPARPAKSGWGLGIARDADQKGRGSFAGAAAYTRLGLSPET